MQLISKVVFSLFLFSLTTYDSFTQETSISTKFIENGQLYANFNDFSKPLTQFKEGENCIVTDYLGQNIYKIKYKEWEGYVKDQYILVNESMMDLYFDFEEKQRLKAINEKENRLKERKNIAKAGESQINKQRKLDSIAKAEKEQQKQIEAIRFANEKYIQLNKQRKLDSITEAEKKQQKQIETIRIANEKYIQLNKQRKLDSIAKAEEEQQKKIEAIRIANEKYIQLNKQRKIDSIAKAEEEQQKQIETLRITNEKLIQLNTQRKIDSIAKAEDEQQKQIETLRIANEKHIQLNKQRKIDSIAKAEDDLKKQIEIQKIAREKQRKQDYLNEVQLEQQKKPNSIVKNTEEEQEKLNSRSTCHYLINEYDQYYKREVIITDKYFINQNLNIELLREGSTSRIHINLLENLGCTNYVPSSRSSARITLENNEVIILYHSGSLDCNDFSLKAIISASKIDQLKNSPIKSLELRGTKKSVTISDIDYKEFFIDKLKCIE
ncbi:hypothetical protein SAMN05428642_1011194 [Flaviramulus basaltis]|uniref:SH3 domain-containing protein n=1 Tax=Flaviramulus basaltis TaxID=369401 RepID=A0A1K2IER0_9FLAO|nr:hypothetical protein [Flaviramulus basaltis]SFZ90871.1 hypothetical protein SAMN05428642_1011194 [Flaviramulus basaltis]